MIGTSIGIALFPGDGASRRGSGARGRHGALPRQGSRPLDLPLLRGARWIRVSRSAAASKRDLRQAISRTQLELHYQPLADCDSAQSWASRRCCVGVIRSAACLAGRVHSAGRGMRPHHRSWANGCCATACREAADLARATRSSPSTCRRSSSAMPDLAEGSADHPRSRPAWRPDRLELEITEGVLIDDTDRTLETLNTLEGRRRAHLARRFRHRLFVARAICTASRSTRSRSTAPSSGKWRQNPDSMSIVRAVIALGRSLASPSRRKASRRRNQLALLQNENCDQAQGYLLGRPMQPPGRQTPPRRRPRLVPAGCRWNQAAE